MSRLGLLGQWCGRARAAGQEHLTGQSPVATVPSGPRFLGTATEQPAQAAGIPRCEPVTLTMNLSPWVEVQNS